MRVLELSPEALAGRELVTISGEARIQYSAGWLSFTANRLESIVGPGAQMSVLAAFEGSELLAAIPMIRTSEEASARPFPMDFEDLFFGLWARNLGPGDPGLRARAWLSQGFGKVLGALNPSLRRTLVLHGPLAPASEALVAPRLALAHAALALSALVCGARRRAAAEGRCAVIPRLMRRDRARWGEALEGWTQVPSYSSAEYLPAAPPEGRTRQMIRRNARLMERAATSVETSRLAPTDLALGALFAQTAARHRDPAPRLDDRFFNELGARFAPRVRFLCARRGSLAAGFVAVLEHGSTWEAFKCGADRVVAGQAPVYLDLLYGRLREVAAAEGVARVDLGPGDLHVKRRYGARSYAVDAWVALPPSFRGGRALTAYLGEVGEGIARHEIGSQVESVATTPK